MANFLFVSILDYALRTSLDKHYHLGFSLSPKLWSRYPAIRLTDIDYANNLAFTADTITNVPAILHPLENAVNDFRPYINDFKTEFTSFNQQVSITNLLD